MNKKNAIFDMDGTLIDSMHYWNNLGREYLESKGITQDLEETLREIVPLSMSESASLLVSRYLKEESADKVMDEMNRMMERHYLEDIPLKPRVKKYLNQLKDNGVRMCVVSVTAEHLVEGCLKRLGIIQLFDFILSCETLCTNKREPDIYLKAAACFGEKPGDIAIYEDAVYAVNTAKKAGFFTVAVHDRATESEWERIQELADETVYFD